MGLFGQVHRIMVVDVAAALKSKGVRGRAMPRQQLQVLRSLSRLAKREKVKVIAVIAGEPLNKAPNNKEVEGVRVRYVKSADKLHAALLSSVKRAGSAGVLVTSHVELEKKAHRAGRETLRVSTFRKLLDDGSDEGGQGGGGNRDRNNNRPRRDRDSRPDRRKPRPQKPAKKREEVDEISQMIDLVE